MKICPGCKRYYADDTQVFCLEDGVQLDFVADPNATYQMPPARDTDPPATLVLPPNQSPAGSGSETWPAQPGANPPPDPTQPAGQIPPTIPSGAPPAVPGAGQMRIPVYGGAGAAPVKKSSIALLATVVVLVVVVLGLGGVLGYVWLNSDGRTTGRTNVDVNVGPPGNNGRVTVGGSNTANNTRGGSGNDNTVGSSNSNTPGGGSNANVPGGGSSGAWLVGTWVGNGTQYDGGKWTFKYTNMAGTHTVEYPSVRCGGRWDPVEITATQATFNEVITHGQNCISNGKVVVIPTADGTLSCKWYYVGDIIGAEAILHREALK